jgi:cystathionine beta-lyase
MTPQSQTTLQQPLREALTVNFDLNLNRRESDSGKWNTYPADVLPMWVADMDFLSPPAVIEALRARADHGAFGYGKDPVRLRELICARMEALYSWHVAPEQIVFLPGLVSGLNLVARATGEVGSGILVNTPVYPPFLSAPTNQERELHQAAMAHSQQQDSRGRTYLHYEVDFDALEAAVQSNTKMFMFCNPHNPVGRAYTQKELEQITDFCLRHNLEICSDEIHCDLLLGDTQHLPIASLNPELAERSITLLAPSKTFNVPGLGCSLAIIPNSDVRQRVQRTAAGILPHVNLMGYVAAIAAYENGLEWLEELKKYLTANRDLLFNFVKERMPETALTLPEATYLAWLDFRAYGIDDPYKFFLDNAKVALSSGTPFGEPGIGYARFNFGTSKALLTQALEQMAEAVDTVGRG